MTLKLFLSCLLLTPFIDGSEYIIRTKGTKGNILNLTQLSYFGTATYLRQTLHRHGSFTEQCWIAVRHIQLPCIDARLHSATTRKTLMIIHLTVKEIQ